MTPSQILKHLLHVRLRCLSVLRGSGCSFILLAVPFTQITSLAPEILKGKIVIDANNYYPERDGH